MPALTFWPHVVSPSLSPSDWLQLLPSKPNLELPRVSLPPRSSVTKWRKWKNPRIQAVTVTSPCTHDAANLGSGGNVLRLAPKQLVEVVAQPDQRVDQPSD